LGLRIGRGFFRRYTPTVARELIGCRLVRVIDGKRLSGLIVETEAYRGSRDPASHAFGGRTARNEVMFGRAGHAYVYFSMGTHYCLNITTETSGTPAAVLIRAIRPLEGVNEMRKRRGLDEMHRLAAGPGNLTRALGIGRDFNGEDVVSSPRLFLEIGGRIGEVGSSSRVGVSKGTSFRWRFFARGNPFVSKGRPSNTVKP
jgi:DNA-3-methyladenine glycosylase